MAGRSDVRHPVFARLYARLTPAMEQGVGEYRRRLLAGLRGTVVEVGAGDGMNFAHYPPEVGRVVAVEPEPYLRNLARRRAEGAAVAVEVVEGRAEDLPLDDAAADAAVASLVLCSVADPDAALAELFRVLRPGGELRVFEHVRAPHPAAARVQRVLDVFWPLIAGGCHTSRDTAAAIRRAGFVFDQLESVRFPDSRVPFPTSPHILGIAVRPPDAVSPRDACGVTTDDLSSLTAPDASCHTGLRGRAALVAAISPVDLDGSARRRR